MTETEIEQRVMETEAREYAFWEAHSIGVKAGVESERNRILHLLKDKRIDVSSHVFDAKGILDQLISVISGE